MFQTYIQSRIIALEPALGEPDAKRAKRSERRKSAGKATDLLLSVTGVEANGAVSLLSKSDTSSIVSPCYVAGLATSASGTVDGGGHL